MHSRLPALFPSLTKLLVSDLSHIFCHMDVIVVMNMDASPNSLNGRLHKESKLKEIVL